MGRLEVITGPMFSGKTEELMRRLRRAQIAGKSVALFKPHIDTRYKKNKVVTHAGQEMDCQFVEKSADLYLNTLGYDVVGVDEIQFIQYDASYPWTPSDTVVRMAERQIVIVSGLDQTFRRHPFDPIPMLLAMADRIDKLTAVCHSCGRDATLTQRLVDGKPAPFSGPTIQVGGLESYEARCKDCFEQG